MRNLVGVVGALLTLIAIIQFGTVQADGPDVLANQQFLPIVEQPEPATPTLTPAPTLTPTLVPTTEPTTAPNCAPEYPTVCIPPPPPDLDCADIPYRRFTVLPPDRHHFDIDGDGIGCETG